MDIIQFLPSKRRRSPSGWISFNAPCCEHRGHKPDTRGRGGILPHNTGFAYSCFNCGFKTAYTAGEKLGFKLRQLLSWLGVDPGTIEALQLQAIRNQRFLGVQPEYAPPPPPPEYPVHHLDPRIVPLTSDHSRQMAYLQSRGIDPGWYPFLVDPGDPRPGIVIPLSHDGKIVGQTMRYLDDRHPRYVHTMPPGYVFGTDMQQPHWKKVIVVEGIMDAITIGGVAVLHNDINTVQVQHITALNREVIVVPDRDFAGMALVDRAMELGWAVSFPNWSKDIKDTADAVKIYGRLCTLITIQDTVSTSSIKILLGRRKFA